MKKLFNEAKKELTNTNIPNPKMIIDNIEKYKDMFNLYIKMQIVKMK